MASKMSLRGTTQPTFQIGKYGSSIDQGATAIDMTVTMIADTAISPNGGAFTVQGANATAGTGGAGSAINLTAGDSDAPGQGGIVTITAGNGAGVGAAVGGDIDLQAGAGLGGSAGGEITITAGSGGTTGAQGRVLIQAGDGIAASPNNGGNVVILAGDASAAAAANGGEIQGVAGDGGNTGSGGDASLTGGNSTGANDNAGNASMQGGNATGAGATANGGSGFLQGGTAVGGTGGNAGFLAGASTNGDGGLAGGIAGASTNANGGDIFLQAGASTNVNGGNVTAFGGAGAVNGGNWVGIAGAGGTGPGGSISFQVGAGTGAGVFTVLNSAAATHVTIDEANDFVFVPSGTNVISVTGTTNYENNVTADDDIPNRRFVTDGTGIQRLFRVGAAAQALPFGAAIFTTVLTDTNVRTDADYAYAAGVITVATSGWYKVSGAISADQTGNNRTMLRSRIHLNGAQVAGSDGFSYGRNNGIDEQTSVSECLVNVTAGDTIELVANFFARNGTPTLVTMPEGTRLMIERAG